MPERICRDERGFPRFAEHPRLARAPRITGLDATLTVDGAVQRHGHSPAGMLVRNTVLVADLARHSDFPVPVMHCFDSMRLCRVCSTPFLRFAAGPSPRNRFAR